MHKTKSYQSTLMLQIYSPNHSKTLSFEIWMFLSRFQMVFDEMAAIYLDFKWLGFQISDPIQNPYQMQPKIFLTI